MRKIGKLLYCVSFCVVGALSFPHLSNAYEVVDETGCTVCHLVDFSGLEGRIHSVTAHVDCNQCHTTPGDSPLSSKCTVCHPLGDPGKCQLSLQHEASPDYGPESNSCFTCHTDCEPLGEYLCYDGIDNDGDGKIDCADVDCDGFELGSCDTGQPGVCADGTLKCEELSEQCVQIIFPSPEICDDGLDNDCDGLTDLDDLDCEQCDDGIDNDGDGKIDCADEDCDGFERGPCDTGQPGVCADGTLKCEELSEQCVQITRAKPEICDDGLDNDCDGLTDSNDQSCKLPPKVAHYEVLDTGFSISTTRRHEWNPYSMYYNPIDNDFFVSWRTSGKLRDDCDPGDNYECTYSFNSVHAAKISPEGEILTEITISPPEGGPVDNVSFKELPRHAHNIFTNEYMILYGISYGPDPYANDPYYVKIDNVGKILYGPERLYPSPWNLSFTNIAFNTVRREYMVVCVDRNIFSETSDNVGFILDEDGGIVKGPFNAGTGDGFIYTYFIEYNPNDDTYLLNWEDFRNATGAWFLGPSDIYGCLLDGDGNVITEIPTMDDTGMPDEGLSQWRPDQAYNPDRNEWLVCWADLRPSLDGPGLMGRILNGDGSFKGDPFIIVDAPGSQGFQEIEYVQEKKMYFVVWQDARDYIPAPEDPPWVSMNDIYGKWLDGETGLPIGPDILIFKGEGDQSMVTFDYSPLMDRFLIAWWEFNVENDYEPIPDVWGADPLWHIPMALLSGGMDIRGAVYGSPSFLSGQVIEEGTGNPVEDAWTLVIGPSFPALKKTNVGGWFNVVKKLQPAGIYLVMVFKPGYHVAMKVVNYTGEPLQETLEVNKLW